MEYLSGKMEDKENTTIYGKTHTKTSSEWETEERSDETVDSQH